jgi:hypothetical protein
MVDLTCDQINALVSHLDDIPKPDPICDYDPYDPEKRQSSIEAQWQFFALMQVRDSLRLAQRT